MELVDAPAGEKKRKNADASEMLKWAVSLGITILEEDLTEYYLQVSENLYVRNLA
jgi:hypothetical protein